MSYRTTVSRLMPWLAGANLTDDLPLIPPRQQAALEHAIIGIKGNARQRDGISANWDSGTSDTGTPIVGGCQFFFGSSTPKTDRRVAVDVLGNIYSYSEGGTRTTLSGGTAWTSPTQVSFQVFNNKLIMAADGAANPVKQWDGTTLSDLSGAPNASAVGKWKQRLILNDKTDPDRVHLSAPFDETKWQGEGDSYAIPVGVGDGDELGVVGFLPEFKGDFFAGKGSRLFRLSGDDPSTVQVSVVSNSIGLEGPNCSCAIDGDDVFFRSRRGVHSLLTTASYGDFEEKFLSRDISKRVRDQWVKGYAANTQMVYVPELSSMAMAVTDSGYDAIYNKAVYLYNVDHGQWYVWPNVECSALFTARDSDVTRIYLGTFNDRVAKAGNGATYDLDEAGAQVAIPYVQRTGVVYVDDKPEVVKGFKRAGVMMRLTANTTVTVRCKIDNADWQTYNVTNPFVGPLLGVSFVLGQSLLGGAALLAPYEFPIDGYGRGIQVEVSKEDVDSELDVQALFVEHDSAELAQQMQGDS